MENEEKQIEEQFTIRDIIIHLLGYYNNVPLPKEGTPLRRCHDDMIAILSQINAEISYRIQKKFCL